ncbi:MAG: hypothetical protein ABI429_10665 [Jatrophihabitantaceae bacterium]
MASRLEMICEVGSPTDAVLIHDLRLPIDVLRVAEHFTISHGPITRIRQVHDTAALRAAGFGNQGDNQDGEQGRQPRRQPVTHPRERTFVVAEPAGG